MIPSDRVLLEKRQSGPIMKTDPINQNLLVVTYDKMVEDEEVGI